MARSCALVQTQDSNPFLDITGMHVLSPSFSVFLRLRREFYGGHSHSVRNCQCSTEKDRGQNLPAALLLNKLLHFLFDMVLNVATLCFDFLGFG